MKKIVEIPESKDARKKGQLSPSPVTAGRLKFLLETCWGVLRLLPPAEAKKVLTALRKRITEQEQS